MTARWSFRHEFRIMGIVSYTHASAITRHTKAEIPVMRSPMISLWMS